MSKASKCFGDCRDKYSFLLTEIFIFGIIGGGYYRYSFTLTLGQQVWLLIVTIATLFSHWKCVTTSPGYLPKNTEANEDDIFYLDKCKFCFIDRLTFRLVKDSTEIANYNHHCSTC